MSTLPSRADVVVVGAGPGGSAAAAYAARAGHEVLLLDAAQFPRDKTCGDGLTPRAIAELQHLGAEAVVADRARILGLSMHGWGGHQQVQWPAGSFPSFGSAIPRTDFDDAIRCVAIESGATMIGGARVAGAHVRSQTVTHLDVVDTQGVPHSVEVRQVIVADGVRSTLGRELGRTWHRDTAYGVAARSYIASAQSHSSWMGSDLELCDGNGTALPGYGWVFPLGDGTVNIGVGALATARRPAALALKPIIGHYAAAQRDSWELSGQPERVASALLPMGGAVSGVAGTNWMLIGDAAACVNPLNGEGIDYALETARFAAARLDAADHTQDWPALLAEHYGTAFSAARRLASILTMPRAVPLLGKPGIRSQALMSMVVRVMGNLITPEDHDLIARAWRTAGVASTHLDTRPPFS